MKSAKVDSEVLIKIQPAQPKDAKALCLLLREVFKDSYLKYSIYQSIKADRYLEEQIAHNQVRNISNVYLIRGRSSVLAFYIANKGKQEYFLSYIATNHSVRGKGLGRTLLNHYEEKAVEAGCSKTGLEVFESNKKTVDWYARNGYRAQSCRFHKRIRLAAYHGEEGPELLVNSSDLEQALSEEENKGFSKIACSAGEGSILLGIIGGEICRVIKSKDLTILDSIKAVANSVFGSRRWLLLSTTESEETLIGIESADTTLYMTKCIMNT